MLKTEIAELMNKDGQMFDIAQKITYNRNLSAEEKAKGLLGSMMGVVGLECAFPVMYTEFVKKGIIDMMRLTELMCTAPRERFSLKGDAGFSIWDVSTPYRINPDNFKTLGRATPFEDREVYGKCLCTSIDNKAIWISEDIK